MSLSPVSLLFGGTFFAALDADTFERARRLLCDDVYLIRFKPFKSKTPLDACHATTILEQPLYVLSRRWHHDHVRFGPSLFLALVTFCVKFHEQKANARDRIVTMYREP
jgi:hypothetical protein